MLTSNTTSPFLCRRKRPPADKAPESQSPDWVAEVMAEHRESRAALDRLNPMPLGIGLTILFWVLRIYVIFMLTVVTVSVLRTLH